MSTPNLLEGAGTAAYNNIYTLFTGQPVPGSAAAKQKQIESLRLEKQLQDELKPKQGEGTADFLKRIQSLNDLALDTKRKQGLLDLELGGGPGTTSQMDIRQRLEQLGIQRESARTQNEKDLLDARNQAKLQLLNPVLGQELTLDDRDTARMDKVLGYLERSQDKNLAAQAEARRPNFGSIAGLLGSLGLAAASLFS